MESSNVHNNVTPFSGDTSTGQTPLARSDAANALAHNVRTVSTGDYLSVRELPDSTDNGQQLRMRAVVMAANAKVGKNKPARKPAKGLIDHKQVSRRKDVNGSSGCGKWHSCNGPKSKTPSAGCRSLKYHMFKGVI